MQAPQPATHIWCPICRAVKPIRAEVIPEASLMKSSGFDGDHLKCAGCATLVATVLIKVEADG